MHLHKFEISVFKNVIILNKIIVFQNFLKVFEIMFM